MKRCAHCPQTGNRRTSSRLCADCLAAGWRWCSIGKHTVTAADYVSSRRACRACRREETRTQKLRRRGVPIAPPPGYVPMVEYARARGYTASWLRRIAVREGLRIWQRTPRGTMFVAPAPAAPVAVGEVLHREGRIAYTVGLLNQVPVVYDSPRVYCTLAQWPESSAGRRSQQPKPDMRELREFTVVERVGPSVWRNYPLREVAK